MRIVPTNNFKSLITRKLMAVFLVSTFAFLILWYIPLFKCWNCIQYILSGWIHAYLPNEYNQHFKTCYTCIIFCSIFGYFMKYFVALPSEPNGHTVPDSASRSWGWWWGPFFFTSCVCSSLLRLLLLNVGMNKVWSSGKRSQVFGLGSPKIWRFSNLFAI